MKVVLYARVSSEKQAEKDLSIKAQIKELRYYTEKHGLEIFDIFIDEAKSARTANRPAFQDMISLAKQKNPPFEAILVWKLSRFARNREDSILYKSLLKKKGIQLISINEQIEDSPSGKMLEGMLEVVDEFYSNNLASDTLRGMKENASRGYLNGGSITFGYAPKKINVDGNVKTIYEIDINNAPIVRKVFDLCLNGEGAKDIARIINDSYPSKRVWSRNSILNLLHNERYTGSLIWNRDKSDETVRVKDTHPKIVSYEEFNNVQELIYKRKPNITHPKIVSSKNILNGLIYCSTCGKLFTSYSAKSGKFHYYICQSRFKSGTNICKQKPLSIPKFDSFIISIIKEKIFTPENIEYLIKILNEDIDVSKNENQTKLKIIEKEISDKLVRRKKLYDSIETSILDINDIAPRLKELNQQIGEFENRKYLLELESTQNKFPAFSINELKSYIEDFTQILIEGSITKRKAFISSFIKKIWIDYPTVAIEYTIPINKQENSNKEVLVFTNSGWGERIRTRDNLSSSYYV
jgi:site-specific DNA recombinase